MKNIMIVMAVLSMSLASVGCMHSQSTFSNLSYRLNKDKCAWSHSTSLCNELNNIQLQDLIEIDHTCATDNSLSVCDLSDNQIRLLVD